MNVSLKQISDVLEQFRGAIDEGICIHEVYIDSRQTVNKGLFVPIIGDRFDGHEFLMDAIEHGAIAAIWDKQKEVPSFVPNDFPLFMVDNTIEGLQTIAKQYLQLIQPNVIAITGSNGKTTTKDFVDSVMKKKYKTHKTAGNFNNHIGLPLTVLSMPEDTEVLILEMGMSGLGEISLLSNLAEPDVAIITNIGDSHLEQLKTREGIATAKLEILEGLKPNGVVVIDGDEPLLTNRIVENDLITCGFNEENDILISNVEITGTEMSFCVGSFGEYKIKTIGKHHAKNASYVISLGARYEIPVEDIQAGLLEVDLTGMRFEMEQGKSEVTLINDAYNASPTSMKAAIETLKEIEGLEQYVVVLGDMFELGDEEEALHRSVVSVIDESITHVITIGEKAAWIADECKRKRKKIKVHAYANKDEAVSMLNELANEETIMLFKSSRKLQLETLILQLKQ